jgi:L-ascorbate metabolism protein UlaG (beta-lactamase superfamily)
MVPLQMDIIYLENSGFVVQTAQHTLVFDYYQDTSDTIAKLLQKGKLLHVFSSHSHHDHFNPIISTWQDQVAAFFLSDDIGNVGISPEKIVWLRPYETSVHGNLQVKAYGSTDLGVSFLVEVDGWRLFHAGDLNWWHWKWDHKYNQVLAQNLFEKEMDKLEGLQLDVAFFPVDSRLEEYRSIGVKEFCSRVNVEQLVAMHTRGERWSPPSGFFAKGKVVAFWCPIFSGDRLQVKKSQRAATEF